MAAPEVSEHYFIRCDMCLNRTSTDELGDHSTEMDARETDATRPWRSRKRIPLTDLHVHGMPATPLHCLSRQGDWQSTCDEIWLDTSCHLHFQPLFHLCTRGTPATSTVFSFSQRLTRSLNCRRSSGPKGSGSQMCGSVRQRALDRAMQAARANTAPTQRLWSKVADVLPHWILRVARGHKQQEEGLGSIRDEIRKRLAQVEEGDLEQLLHGAIDDQERHTHVVTWKESPGVTDAEDDKPPRAASRADRRQLNTAARLFRGSAQLTRSSSYITRAKRHRDGRTLRSTLLRNHRNATSFSQILDATREVY